MVKGAKQIDQDAIIIKHDFDFDKAYDKIKWLYIF